MLAHADAVVGHFGTVHQVYNNAGIAYNGNVDKSEPASSARRRRLASATDQSPSPHVIASGDGQYRLMIQP